MLFSKIFLQLVLTMELHRKYWEWKDIDYTEKFLVKPKICGQRGQTPFSKIRNPLISSKIGKVHFSFQSFLGSLIVPQLAQGS